MYVVTPYPNILYALDLTKPGAPMKWKYQPEARARRRRASPAATWSIAAPPTADGKIFFNTLDGNTIALDADTGKLVWNTKLGDINIGETITMAPLVVKGQGSGRQSRAASIGVRGWLTGARRDTTASSSGRPTAPARTRTC